jgi:CHRD domain
MKKLCGILVVSLALLAIATPAASQSLQRTFVVQLTATEQVPVCAATDASDHGVALFRLVDVEAGIVEYKVIATDLPGTLAGAPGVHIHGPAPAGQNAGIVQALDLTGAEVGVIAEGTFTNPDLVAAALENPELFYVNVHTTACPGGAIRGQLG